MSQEIKKLLCRLDWDMKTLFAMIERTCNESHMDDASIAAIVGDGGTDDLEIISDTADEVAAKALPMIVEARLAIRTFLEAQNG